MALEEIILNERPNRLETPERGGKASVFIVDDEARVGEVVSMVLSLEGFKTRLFTSPKDALEALEATGEKPGLLITDYAMLPFNGIDLIEKCRRVTPGLRAILYSGNASDKDIAAYGTVPDAFLSKPFLPKQLIQTVQAVLASS
jgi:DNA-binding NtrC family response regulator